MKINPRFACTLLFFSAAAFSPLCAQGVLYVMYSFSTGETPNVALVQRSDGNFYATSGNAGASSNGTVFSLTPPYGNYTSLGSLGTGTDPNAALVLGSDGNLYGTTQYGGNASVGTAFKVTLYGGGGAYVTTLVSFGSSTGFYPNGFVLGRDGYFYGTTNGGGSNNKGMVFRMDSSGNVTTLVSFTGTNGSGPDAALVQGSDGNFYGTAATGGAGSSGTVFKMTPSGTLTTLVSFNGTTTGGVPVAPLVQGSDGNFYGTTVQGGSNSDGTVFKLASSGGVWTLTTLVSFNGTNGASPYGGLVQGHDGYFYGTTKLGGSSGKGTVFAMTPAGALTTMASFTGTNGSYPVSTLIQARDGVYYGTTSSGGTSGNGVAFQFSFSQAVAPTFSPGAGTYTSAQNVTITSATSGASIAYTTDGSTPTESGGAVTHGTLLTNGASVSVGASANLNAIAFKIGFTDSTVATAAYVINFPKVATPTFSPVAGTYTSAQTVAISTTTSGATICYTTDGSPPTETHGTLLSNGGSVSVSASVTLNAIAYESGYTDSNVGTANYVINLPPAATPTFSPSAGTYTSAQNVTITSATSGASIAYTTDGSTPTETHGTLLSNGGSVSVSANTTLNAMAFASNYTDSSAATANYIINIPQTATPTFSPPGGAYAGAQSVTITSTTSSASIAYTTDGSPPAESGGSVTNGTLLSNGGSVSIGTNTTLNAMAFASGYTDSSVATAAYTISAPIPTTVRIQGSNGNRPPTNFK
jgi:uncharacterized repeat protein (TIGR03803 family)